MSIIYSEHQDNYIDTDYIEVIELLNGDFIRFDSDNDTILDLLDSGLLSIESLKDQGIEIDDLK